MSDKKNNMGDEYQFPHDEYVTAEDDTQQPNYDAFKDEEGSANAAEVSAADTEDNVSQKRSLLERFPILQNKRILTVVGVAVVAFVAFQFMTPSHKKIVMKKTQKTTQQSSVNRMQQEQENTLLNKVNDLSKSTSSAQNVENALRNEVSELKTSLNKTTKSNQAMREAVVVLAQQVEHLSKEVKKATTIPKHIKKLPPSPVLTFHLRAIIPGRAWVEGSNGESDSVTVGTKLKNYGTVKAIDANAGKVLTSSGKVITYNGDGN